MIESRDAKFLVQFVRMLDDPMVNAAFQVMTAARTDMLDYITDLEDWRQCNEEVLVTAARRLHTAAQTLLAEIARVAQERGLDLKTNG